MGRCIFKERLFRYSVISKRERYRLRMKENKKINTAAILVITIGIVLCVLTVWASMVFFKSLQDGGEGKEVISMDVFDIEEPVAYTAKELEALLSKARKEGQESVLDALAEGLNSDNTTLVEALRPLYEDKLVVVSGGKYHFIPIDHTLKMHSYVNENLQISVDGFVEYAENGTVISHKGIDVSKHQGEIDWEKVAADGVEFAFIRVGNRGYGSGVIVEDAQFEANIKGAAENGIKVGVYFFSQAVNEEEAVEEAEFVLEKIAPYQIECPVVLDVEKVSDSNARMNKISTEERTANALAFLEKVKEAGYRSMLYHNMEMGTMLLDLTQFETYDKWFAYYNKEFYYPYAFDVWQYSAKGRVNGIAGDVDLNISFHMWEK